jgi:uncharacterized protein YciI
MKIAQLFRSAAIFTALFSTIVFSQSDNGSSQKTDAAFDSVLAQQLKADDYGMRKYVMAFLRKGPNRSKDTTVAKQLQAAHMKNINRMAEEGVLSVAGPFLDGGDLRGIYVFNVETVEEARKLTETDPLIQSGGLVMELHPWYCSAALMQVNAIHGTISRIKF